MHRWSPIIHSSLENSSIIKLCDITNYVIQSPNIILTSLTKTSSTFECDIEKQKNIYNEIYCIFQDIQYSLEHVNNEYYKLKNLRETYKNRAKKNSKTIENLITKLRKDKHYKEHFT